MILDIHVYWKQKLFMAIRDDRYNREWYVHVVKVYVLFFLLWQASEKRTVKVQADDPISFAQLVNKAEMGATEVQNSNYKDKRSKKEREGDFRDWNWQAKFLKRSFLFVSM